MRYYLKGEIRSLCIISTRIFKYLGIPENLHIKFDKWCNFSVEEVKYTKSIASFPMSPTYDEIEKANSLRGNEIKKTPLIHSPMFSELTGSDVYLKAEFRQKTGSFKIRGAYYKIKSLSNKEKKIWLDVIYEINKDFFTTNFPTPLLNLLKLFRH